MQKDHIHMLKIQQSMLEFSDYGNIKITQHALKVSVFTLLKLGTIDYKEEVANHYTWRGLDLDYTVTVPSSSSSC